MANDYIPLYGATQSGGAFTLTIVSGHATPDLAQGKYQYLTLPNGTTTIINAPVGDQGPGSEFWLVLMQDATGGGKVTLPWIAPVAGSPGTPGYLDMREIDIRANAITRILLSKKIDNISWLLFCQTDIL